MTGIGLKVLFLPGAEGGCSYVRSELPARALVRRGWQAKVGYETTWGELAQQDVVVFQRQPEKIVRQIADYCRLRGVATVFDIDDSAQGIGPDNPNYFWWGRDKRAHARVFNGMRESLPYAMRQLDAPAAFEKAQDMLAGLYSNMRACTTITVSTEPLRAEYGRFGPCVVLPNGVDMADWDIPRPQVDEKVRLCLAGSKTHLADWRVATPGILQILEEEPQVELVIVGFPEARELLFAGHPRVATVEWQDVRGYRAYVALCDIGLAPVFDSPFNRAKSDLKYLEYSALGLPTVASPACYADTIRHGETGFIAKNTKDWIAILRRLVRDGDLRARVGQAARSYVERERQYDRAVVRWEAAYQQAIKAARRMWDEPALEVAMEAVAV